MEKIHFSEICVICLDEESSHIFRPCLHMCICEVCTQEYVGKPGNTCPMCRKRYTSIEFHERPPIEIEEDDFDDIFARVLKISEEELMTYEKLKDEEEEQYNQAVLESLICDGEKLTYELLKDLEREQFNQAVVESLVCEDSKILRFAQSTTNLAIPSSSNTIHPRPDVSKGAIPKTSKFYNTSSTGTLVNDFSAGTASTSSSELQRMIVSDKPLEMYVQLTETVIIYYNKNMRVTSASSTGRISLVIFAKDISLNNLRNISSNDSLVFKFDNTRTLKNIEHDSSVQSQLTADKNHMYVACDELVPNLRDSMRENPSSFSYNISVLNYKINGNKCPLDVDFIVFGDLLSSQLTVNYKYCPERIYPETSLRKFKLTVRIDTPFTNVDCVPTAKIVSNNNELSWSFDEINKMNGTGCLKAKYQFVGKSRPLAARISLEYSCLDASLSGINLDKRGMNISPNYRIKDIGQKLTIKEFFIAVENNKRA